MDEYQMMTIDEVVGRMLQLEQDIIELQRAYDQLKEEYYAYRVRHRDESETRQDSRSSNQGH